MKKLFMIIFIPILFVLGTPALILTIMYDGSGENQMPTYLYTEDADAQQMLLEELSAALADAEDGVTDDVIFNLHQDIINTAIFQAIRDNEGGNPDYMPNDDCVEDSCNYIFAQPVEVEGFGLAFRVVGVWVDFEDDKFITNVFLEINLNDGFTYKTNLETHFIFRDTLTEYTLEFDKIQIGNLPIPKALISTVINTIDNQIDQVDLEESTADIPYGDFDITNLSYSILKDDILDIIAEKGDGEAGTALGIEVLKIIFDNDLLTFTFTENEFVLSAGISKIRNDEGTDIPDYLYGLHYIELVGTEEVVGAFNPDAFDPEEFLTNKFTEFVFNYALAGGTGFVIKERTFNKIIYDGSQGFETSGITKEFENSLGVLMTVNIGLEAIWFELAPDDIYINALFNLNGIPSLIQIRAEEVSNTPTDLVFEFTEITFGKDLSETDGDYVSIIDLDVFKQVFAELGDVEFGSFDENGTLTISATSLTSLMQDGSQEGTVTVTAISLVQDGIELTIEVEDTELSQLLTDFGDAIEEAFVDPTLLDSLETVLDTAEEGPEIIATITDIQDLLNDGDDLTNPTAEQITDLFENFENLDSATQEEFLNVFEGLIDPDLYADYEGSFTE